MSRNYSQGVAKFIKNEYLDVVCKLTNGRFYDVNYRLSSPDEIRASGSDFIVVEPSTHSILIGPGVHNYSMSLMHPGTAYKNYLVIEKENGVAIARHWSDTNTVSLAKFTVCKNGGCKSHDTCEDEECIKRQHIKEGCLEGKCRGSIPGYIENYDRFVGPLRKQYLWLAK